jgi:hypothetical protein
LPFNFVGVCGILRIVLHPLFAANGLVYLLFKDSASSYADYRAEQTGGHRWVPYAITRPWQTAIILCNRSVGKTMELDTFIRQLHADDIDQACRMTGSQKLRAGGDLFDEACRWTLAGIRAQHPGISDADALEELRRRVRGVETTERA